MYVTFLKSAFRESHFPIPDKPEIAFAGRSNVGKSSLLNVLVNRKKIARTSSTPGRTQAINFFSVNDKLYFVDLPGYGFARVPLSTKRSWGKMIETYLRTRLNLKAVVVIMDVRRDPHQGDKELLNCLKQYHIKSIIVLTKADKLSRNKLMERSRLLKRELEGFSSDEPTIFSAKTRLGKETIWKKIKDVINF